MQQLADRQRDFSVAILDPALPAPHGLVGPDGEPSSRRFAVYRNNVTASLTEALRNAFPAVCRIVGAEFFTAMARAYIHSDPPRSPILHDYGACFPRFIAKFRPAASLPYLADVARIERAWTEAYHSPEAARLEAAAFASIETDQLPHIHLVVHPSARIVASRLPALTIWRMNVGDGVPAQVDLAAGGEDTLIIRPMAEVEVRSMPPGGAKFLKALVRGRSIIAATTAAVTTDARFDLAANLAELIGASAFVDYRFADEPRVATARRLS